MGAASDIARFRTIRHDSHPKPYDSRAKIYDSSAKIHDLRPKLNDRQRECLTVVCAAEIVRNREAIGRNRTGIVRFRARIARSRTDIVRYRPLSCERIESCKDSTPTLSCPCPFRWRSTNSFLPPQSNAASNKKHGKSEQPRFANGWSEIIPIRSQCKQQLATNGSTCSYQTARCFAPSSTARIITAWSKTISFAITGKPSRQAPLRMQLAEFDAMHGRLFGFCSPIARRGSWPEPFDVRGTSVD